MTVVQPCLQPMRRASGSIVEEIEPNPESCYLLQKSIRPRLPRTRSALEWSTHALLGFASLQRTYRSDDFRRHLAAPAFQPCADENLLRGQGTRMSARRQMLKRTVLLQLHRIAPQPARINQMNKGRIGEQPSRGAVKEEMVNEPENIPMCDCLPDSSTLLHLQTCACGERHRPDRPTRWLQRRCSLLAFLVTKSYSRETKGASLSCYRWVDLPKQNVV